MSLTHQVGPTSEGTATQTKVARRLQQEDYFIAKRFDVSVNLIVKIIIIIICNSKGLIYT
jgi:hypothetical protein